MHDPAHQAEADARAKGADTGRAAGQETADPREPATDRMVGTDGLPTAGQDGGAGLTDGASQRSSKPTAGDEVQQSGVDAAGGGVDGVVGEGWQPEAGVEPEGADALVVASMDTWAIGRTPEPRPAASRASSGSTARLQREWVTLSEVSSETACSGLTTAVTLDMVHALFADHRE